MDIAIFWEFMFLASLLLVILGVAIFAFGIFKYYKNGQSADSTVKTASISGMVIFFISITIFALSVGHTPQGQSEPSKKDLYIAKQSVSLTNNEAATDADGNFNFVFYTTKGTKLTVVDEDSDEVLATVKSSKSHGGHDKIDYTLNLGKNNDSSIVFNLKFKFEKDGYKDESTKIENISNLTTSALDYQSSSAASYAAYSSQKEAEKTATAESNSTNISYGELTKSDKHSGEPYYIGTGKIFQIEEENGKTFALVKITRDQYGYYDDIVAVSYNGTTNAVEDDLVKVYGKLGSRYTYETRMGSSNEVPYMYADSIEVVGNDN